MWWIRATSFRDYWDRGPTLIPNIPYLGKIVSAVTPIQKYLQQILSTEGSHILTSYVPGQDNTVVVPTPASQAWINMNRKEIIDESNDNTLPIKNRLCIGTPLKDITVEAHYQSNYLNGFVANKLSAVQVIVDMLLCWKQLFASLFRYYSNLTRLDLNNHLPSFL